MLDYLVSMLPAQLPVNPLHIIYFGGALIVLGYLSLAARGR